MQKTQKYTSECPWYISQNEKIIRDQKKQIFRRNKINVAKALSHLKPILDVNACSECSINCIDFNTFHCLSVRICLKSRSQDFLAFWDQLVDKMVETVLFYRLSNSRFFELLPLRTKTSPVSYNNLLNSSILEAERWLDAFLYRRAECKMLPRAKTK